MQSMVASQALMQAWMRMCWTPWSTSTWNGGALASQASQWQNAMWGVVGKGLAPCTARRWPMPSAWRAAERGLSTAKQG
nr:hypothetical protein [Delftia acidovorans]